MRSTKPPTPLPPATLILIASACLMLLLSFGYRSGFGLFVKPISETHGWGRDIISMSLAIQNLAWGLGAVFAGGLADRFGNLKVILSGVVLYVLGMALMPYATTPAGLNSTLGLLVGAGVAGTSFGIVLPALTRAVPEDRQQFVLGIGTAAGSMGQFAVVPIAQYLIDIYSWAPALHLLAASGFLMALLALPLAPYSGANQSHQISEQTMQAALKEAFAHRSYVLLVLGFYVCGFHVAFITAHMPAYLSDLGFSAQIGAWSIAIIGLCNVVGAYSSGVLSGRYTRRAVLLFIYLARAVVIGLFLLIPTSLTSILIFSAAMGFLWLATVPPTSGLVALMFGTRYMALLYGIVFLSHQLGSFSGVWLGGWGYQNLGSYNVVWYFGVVLSLLAATFHWPIKEQPVARLTAANASLM